MKRKAPMKRGKKLNPVNRKRRKKNSVRAYGPKERREWLLAQPCCLCARRGVQQHHIVNGGMGRKADTHLTVPLCAPCHQAHHDGNLFVPRERWFEVAAWYERAWQEYHHSLRTEA